VGFIESFTPVVIKFRKSEIVIDDALYFSVILLRFDNFLVKGFDLN